VTATIESPPDVTSSGQFPPDPPPPRRLRRSGRASGPPAPRPPLSAWRILFAVAWLGLCALALWAVFYVLVITDMQHARSQHELYAGFREQLALATAPVGGMIPAGKPVAVITIPAAGLHGEVVVEGTRAGDLRAGPGHVRTTPLPGQPGVSLVYGRAVSFGGPFARIAQLPAGSPITVSTDQGTFHYEVRAVRHAGDAWTLPPTGGADLTLVTADGGWTPNRVVYVDAVLNGRPAPDPGGRPTTLAPQENLMVGESDSLTVVQVVLWLQLLVLVAGLITWLRTRWTPLQVWLVGAPVVLAVMWGASNTAVRLLPNLL
jgi:sortase A